MRFKPAARARWAKALGLGLLSLGCSRASDTGENASAGRDKLHAASATPSERPALASSTPAGTGSVEAKAAASAGQNDSGPIRLKTGSGKEPAALAKRVLHIGDSMVPLVGNYLRPLIEKQGGRYATQTASSSTTLSWAEEKTLDEALAKHDPDLVLISLGSNELFFEDDLAQRGAATKKIVDKLGSRACLWIGPPAWAKARGFLDVLEQNLGACGYFDSALLKMERQEDGRHPTWSASHSWAAKVWQRLGGEGKP